MVNIKWYCKKPNQDSTQYGPFDSQIEAWKELGSGLITGPPLGSMVWPVEVVEEIKPVATGSRIPALVKPHPRSYSVGK